jgi:REP element-mobilizing transposase RayT
VPRRRRDFEEGLYHLAPRASDTRHLFSGDAECRTFLGELARGVEDFGLRLVAYVLMGTHYHVVVYTPGGRIPAALRRLHTWHARRHNKEHGRAAHLFRAHCFAREITSDADLLVVCRYLAHNPVRAGLATDPFVWRWSSAAATTGLADAPIPLDPGPIRAAVGDAPDWQRRYQGFLAC